MSRIKPPVFHVVTAPSLGFYLNCKGFNARVVTEWLCDVVIQNPTQDPRHNLVEVALMLG